MTGIAAPREERNVYRFVGVEQSLTDARRAIGEEKWEDALAAAQWLLKQDPPHPEAHKLIDKAEREIAYAAAYDSLKKAIAVRDPRAAIVQIRAIAADSVYQERGRRLYERFRELWIGAREGEVRQAAQRGRCRDARRIAQSAAEIFPESRPRLDTIAEECRPPGPDGETQVVTAPKL